MKRTQRQNAVNTWTVIVGLALMLLFFAIPAAWATSDTTELAVMALPAPEAPLALTATCVDGVAVFSIQNKAAHWQMRGHISIVEVLTGRTLRERTLTLGERQMASFRVPSSDLLSDRYRVTVRLPNNHMTYVKSFTGRCPSPKTNERTTQR